MTEKMLLALVVVAAVACPGLAADLFPAPNVVGATGAVRIPTADVLPYKNFNVAVDYGMNSLSEKAIFLYKMNLGAFQGLELGIVGGVLSEEAKLREGVFINMKYSLSAGSPDNPLLLAIGVENLASYRSTDVYMVVTRYFKDGPKLHFGFMGDFPGEKFRPLGMFGLEFPLFDRMLLMADVLAGETVFQVDAGLRYYFSPTLVLSINGFNLAYAEDSEKEYKDPKGWMFGFAWTNPF